MTSKDSLGDRMKMYETSFRSALPPRMPVIIRVDGKSFSKFTKGFTKPWDVRIETAMFKAALALVSEIQGAEIVYTQSDEISVLVYYHKKFTSQPWFGNEVQKMVSVSASIATAAFSYELDTQKAYFDSRVFVLPEEEVNNYFVWRQEDCVRNSIQSWARYHFSHNRCHNKSCEELKKMVADIGEPWEEKVSQRRQRGLCIDKTYPYHNLPLFKEDPSFINSYMIREEG